MIICANTFHLSAVLFHANLELNKLDKKCQSMPTPRVIHILAVCCCVNIDITVCGTRVNVYMCKMLADVHEAEQIQPATCLPLIDLGLTGHSRRTKLSFFPFMNLPPTDEQFLDDLAVREPFKYCLADFFRQRNPSSP